MPLRVEIGPKDMQKQQMRVVRRDTGAACYVAWDECNTSVHALLDEIQKDLFTRAQEALNASIEKVTSFDEVMGVLNRKHLVLAPWWAKYLKLAYECLRIDNNTKSFHGLALGLLFIVSGAKTQRLKWKLRRKHKGFQRST